MRLLADIKNAVMQRSRAQKFEHFYSPCDRGHVLDVGVEGRERRAPDNLSLETFRFPGQFYTGLGINDLTEVPDIQISALEQYSGRRVPFEDNAFGSSVMPLSSTSRG